MPVRQRRVWHGRELRARAMEPAFGPLVSVPGGRTGTGLGVLHVVDDDMQLRLHRDTLARERREVRERKLERRDIASGVPLHRRRTAQGMHPWGQRMWGAAMSVLRERRPGRDLRVHDAVW